MYPLYAFSFVCNFGFWSSVNLFLTTLPVVSLLSASDWSYIFFFISAKLST